MNLIPFNLPALAGKEQAYVADAIARNLDDTYLVKCTSHLERHYGTRVLLTGSCTAALEMAALLLDIKPGDEVIMPSFTFVSTANAFALRGATLVFVDIRPETMNMDVEQAERAITQRTKAIVPVHYAGVGCEMERLMEVAKQRGIVVVEDAAQAYGASYQGKPLGKFGALGTLSFHNTKNITAGGQGGALVINDAALTARAEILLHKGTDRLRFERGEIPCYQWQDFGSSYTLSPMQAAYLFANMEDEAALQAKRLRLWERYEERLKPLAEAKKISLPHLPPSCQHNAHIFYLKARSGAERKALLSHLHAQAIGAVFHYVPLHSSPAGKRFGRFAGEDRHTTRESERLLRLPLYNRLTDDQAERVAQAVIKFYE